MAAGLLGRAVWGEVFVGGCLGEGIVARAFVAGCLVRAVCDGASFSKCYKFGCKGLRPPFVMADQEIIKHIKAAIDASRDKKRNWSHKIREILLEIGIIVFAVSLSIWLHGWAEDRKDRREEREFLTGMREDLKADIHEMRGDIAWYDRAKLGMDYFERVGAGLPLSPDSVLAYRWVLFSFAQKEPRASRYEALKSSGRMNIIENKELPLGITDLYTKDFPLIRRRNDFVNSLKNNQLMPLVFSKIKIDSKGVATNWQDILREPAMRLMLGAESLENVTTAYEQGIKDCEKVIGEIDKELR